MSRLEERIENFNYFFDIYNDAVNAYDRDAILTHMALGKLMKFVLSLRGKF